jgi:hypothetical protein
MSCFPLYDNLVAQKRGKRFLSKDEKRRFVEDVAKLDQNGHNKIFALIMYHQQVNELSYISSGWMNAIGPTIDLDINLASLPVPLQEIIEIFISRHLVFMEDEKERTLNQ